MRLWREMRDIFKEDVSFSELMDPSRAGLRLRRTLLLVREIWRSLRRDDVLNLAASLAFKTLLALVPVLAISLAIVAMLDAGVGADGAETYTDRFVDAIKDKLPSINAMDNVVEQVHEFANNARTIAGVGFLFLFWTAFSLLNAVEGSFNRVWQVKENRPLLGKLNAFLATLVIVPVLMVLSVVLMASIRGAAEDVLRDNSAVVSDVSSDAPDTRAVKKPVPIETSAQPDTVVQKTWNDVLLRAVVTVSSILFTCLAMTALFYLMPNTPVRLRAALIGGVIAGVMFELAKFGFRTYAAHVVDNYTRIYGPLLAVPLFLLWVWLVWIFILIGSEVAFTLQNFRDLAAKAELETRGISSRVYLAVRVVLRACHYFRDGETPAEFVDRSADELQVPPYMIREIVSALIEGNILRRVIPDEEHFVPAKDIHRLTVNEVVNAIQSDPLDVPARPDDPTRRRLSDLFGQVNTVSDESLGSVTFSDLVAFSDRQREEVVEMEQ